MLKFKIVLNLGIRVFCHLLNKNINILILYLLLFVENIKIIKYISYMYGWVS